MVPPSSDQVSRVWPYSGFCAAATVFTYVTLTLFGGPSHALRLTIAVLKAVRTPKVFLPSVWPLPRSLATTYGISVDFFSSPYLDVSVQAVPPVSLCVQNTVRELSHADCSIRISPDQCLLATPRSFSQLVTSFFGS